MMFQVCMANETWSVEILARAKIVALVRSTKANSPQRLARAKNGALSGGHANLSESWLAPRSLNPSHRQG